MSTCAGTQGLSDPSCPREKALCWAETRRAALPTGREAQRRLWAHLGSSYWNGTVTVLENCGRHDHTSGRAAGDARHHGSTKQIKKDQESRISILKFLMGISQKNVGRRFTGRICINKDMFTSKSPQESQNLQKLG